MYALLKNRRSIRKYKDRLVESEKIEELICSMLMAPSSKGTRPWEIILVDDTSLIVSLANSKAHGAKFLSDAKQCLVVLADTNKTDVWIEDASIVLTIGHLSATNMGLGSCWIQIRNRMRGDGQMSEAFVKDILNIPDTMAVEGILAFGYPDEEKKAYSEESLKWDKIHKNVFGQSYK